MPNRRLLNNNYSWFDIVIVDLCRDFTIANFGSSYVLKNTNKNPRQTQHLTTSAATAWRIQPTQRRPAALWKADDVCYQIVIRLLGYIRLPLLLYPTEVPTWLFCESSASFFCLLHGWRQI